MLVSFDAMYGKNMRKISIALKILLLALSVALGVFTLVVYKRQSLLAEQLSGMVLRGRNLREAGPTSPPSQEVKNIIVRTNPWHEIQDSAKDAVVQVFAQCAVTNILQPYATPQPSACAGSGFFINGDGEIITNAHVVDQAVSVWIQIPSLGRAIIDVDVVGIAPDRDLALLRLTPASKDLITSVLGKINYLELGDSDLVSRADEVLALGYPLGQQSLKSTTGVVSGRENLCG